MGRFRTMGADDVRAVLDAFGLGPYQGHRALDQGTINTNLWVGAAGGVYFLRVNEGKAVEDVEREVAIVAFVAARGVPTPAPVSARDGRSFAVWAGQIVSLFPWVEGRTLRRAEVSALHARQAGAALAALHVAGLGFGDCRPGRYEPDEIDRRLALVKDAARADASLASAIVALEPELAALRSARAQALPEGLIHGDLFPDNVIYRPAGHELAALIDFEQASWGRLAYDLAVATLAFGFGADDFRPDVVRALLDGYAGVRPPSAAERAAFPAELRFAACRFAVTRITDVHLRRGEGAPGGKDFRRYLLRLGRIHEHVAAGDGILQVP